MNCTMSSKTVIQSIFPVICCFHNRDMALDGRGRC
jgi:hypothetical protein